MNRKKMPVEELAALSNDLQASIIRWRQTNSPDDMSRITDDRNRIKTLCICEGMYLPDAYWIPTQSKKCFC